MNTGVLAVATSNHEIYLVRMRVDGRY